MRIDLHAVLVRDELKYVPGHISHVVAAGRI